MRIGIRLSEAKNVAWYEYAVRFVFGGLITVVAGLVAEKWGPKTGGLLLAFPAIFPASATLLENHQRRKKERLGLTGKVRGREAAALDAAGAALGSVGLTAFAVTAWKLLPRYPAPIVLIGATFLWAMTSGLLWRIRKAV